MTMHQTVTLYPSSHIEGKDYQRLNLGARQLNKLIRILETAPEGTVFTGTIAGLFVTVEKKAPAQKPAPVNAHPAYKRAQPKPASH